MPRAGEIVQEDELRDGSPEGQVLRIAGAPPVNVRLAGRHDLVEIPPSELIAVMKRLHPSSNVLPDDDSLFRVLLDHYGYKRLTAHRKRYLSKVVCLFRESI